MRIFSIAAAAMLAAGPAHATTTTIYGDGPIVDDTYWMCSTEEGGWLHQESGFNYCPNKYTYNIAFLTDWPALKETYQTVFRPGFEAFNAVSTSLFLNHRIFKAGADPLGEAEDPEAWAASTSVGQVGVRIKGFREGEGEVASIDILTDANKVTDILLGDAFRNITMLTFEHLMFGYLDPDALPDEETGEIPIRYLYREFAAEDLKPSQIWCDESCGDIWVNSVTLSTDVAQVPLPATAALLGAAIAGLGFWRYRFS